MKGIDMKMDMKSISKNGFLLCIFLLGAIFCALVGFYFLIMVDDEGFRAFFSFLFFAGTAGCVIGLGNVVYDECGERYGDLQYVNLKNISVVIWYRTYLLFRGMQDEEDHSRAGRGDSASERRRGEDRVAGGMILDLFSRTSDGKLAGIPVSEKAVPVYNF